MFTIFGSGFGLYGYLPALIELVGQPIVLPEKYRAVVEGRAELVGLVDRINWVSSAEDALELAERVIFAVPPASQSMLVQKCLDYPRVKSLYLEKPLATTPIKAKELVDNILSQQKQVTVGYTLLHTPWAKALDLKAVTADEVELNWRFLAHHYRVGKNNWKSLHSSGGGALRYYGIHLIALLYRQGYRNAAQSELYWCGEDEPYKWKAQFEGTDLPRVSIEVDSKSEEEEFCIFAQGEGKLLSLREPFEEIQVANSFDPRVSVVANMLAASLDSAENSETDEIFGGIALWADAEQFEKPQHRL